MPNINAEINHCKGTKYIYKDKKAPVYTKLSEFCIKSKLKDTCIKRSRKISQFILFQNFWYSLVANSNYIDLAKPNSGAPDCRNLNHKEKRGFVFPNSETLKSINKFVNL